jgi:outer membrane protein TolC
MGTSIDFPFFDVGLRHAALAIPEARFTQAAESYRSTVLRAVKKV